MEAGPLAKDRSGAPVVLLAQYHAKEPGYSVVLPGHPCGGCIHYHQGVFLRWIHLYGFHAVVWWINSHWPHSLL